MLIVRKSLPDDGRHTYGLIPIDHSFSLPPVYSLDGAFFEWHFWSQAKKPFSPESLAYIQSIDIEEDAKILRGLGISEECIGTMVVCTLLLKKASAAGMTLFEIASLMTRKDLKTRSPLEQLIADAEEQSIRNHTLFTDELEELLPHLLS
eukprot:TRINITY_DN1916_c0_g1_i13.p1 TRINITY_DN1916_c0_g1~~TRINITY_DN1916_c0_g1_i13.p1  ORF type:complete len:150 (-),score=19.09 TRINITY_DN1916_c0_g1_i13:572-1021(-)